MTWTILFCLVAWPVVTFGLYTLAFTLGDYVVLRRALREIAAIDYSHRASRIAREALSGAQRSRAAASPINTQVAE